MQPAVAVCARCGRAAGEAPAWVDLRAGSLACAGCSGRGANRVSLAPEAAALLATLAAGACPGTSSPTSRRVVGLVLHRLLGMHLEGYAYPRALALLKKVDSDPSPAPPESDFPPRINGVEASS